jgi:hypothetical protein
MSEKMTLRELYDLFNVRIVDGIMYSLRVPRGHPYYSLRTLSVAPNGEQYRVKWRDFFGFMWDHDCATEAAANEYVARHLTAPVTLVVHDAVLDSLAEADARWRAQWLEHQQRAEREIKAGDHITKALRPGETVLHNCR